MTIEVVSSLAQVHAAQWNALTGGNPFLRHEFLDALHQSGCASEATGWAPHYLLLKEHGALSAAMPLYLKTHSYGEYVFDWSWADAYSRYGLEYYPKLLCAVPFTPVAGRRLLAREPRGGERLVAGALALARELEVSSLHCLFPTPGEADAFAAHGMMIRHGVQFHWSNADYESFDEFLSSMNHDKRKKVKQERRRVRDAGITFQWREGCAIDERDWAFFFRCYAHTYRERGRQPYLNAEFFQRIGHAMPENLLLVLAYRAGRPIAASFGVHDGSRLYGRYWGAVEHHPMLHFETCYYQLIEYAIARGIQTFEGGAQGEHKMARGLMPVETSSAHWVARREFAAAIEDFLTRESRGIAHYIDELSEHRPFKEPVSGD